MAAALPLAGIAAAPSRPPSPDAHLIAWCNEFLANEAESDRIEEPYWHMRGRVVYAPADQSRVDYLRDRCREIKGLVTETRAVSAEGRRAKARVCRAYLSFDADGEAYDDTDALMASLFDDLIGEARA